MLPYIKAYLRETLRLHPTEPAFTLQAKGDQILDDRFLIKDGEYVQVLLAQFHRDPELWSPNAEEFKPSRMMDKAFGKPPPNAWKVSIPPLQFHMILKTNAIEAIWKGHPCLHWPNFCLARITARRGLFAASISLYQQ